MPKFSSREALKHLGGSWARSYDRGSAIGSTQCRHGVLPARHVGSPASEDERYV